MHATYAVLYNKKDGFQQWKDFLLQDENNWYEELFTVDREGNIELLIEDGDWRERDALGKKFLAKPVEARWQEAVELSQSFAKYEIANAIYRQDWENINIEDSLEELLNKLKEIADDIKRKSKYMDALKCERICTIIRQILSMEDGFSSDIPSAYESIRSHVLAWQFEQDVKPTESQDAAILFIDIHT
jgi:hypothetical protein